MNEVSLQDLNETQRQALLDLLTLAMYADGHLTSAEDARVAELLGAMGLTDETERQEWLDASVTRVRPYTESHERALQHAEALATAFQDRKLQSRVYHLLEELITSDTHISEYEGRFIETIRQKFQM